MQWLSVAGYLYHVTSFLMSRFNVHDSVSVGSGDILRTITKSLTRLIVQVNTACTLQV